MLRPTSVTVFGILNIIFGALGIFGLVFTLIAMSVQPEAARHPFGIDNAVMNAWVNLQLWLGPLASIALIVAGIGLLYMRPWSRTLSIIYAGYAIVTAILGTVLTIGFWLLPAWNQIGAQGNPEQRIGMIAAAIGSVVGSLIGCIYPALLWYFMNRPHVLAAFAGTWLGPAAPDPTNYDVFRPGEELAPVTANPYAAPRTAANVPMSGFSGTESALDTLIPSKNGAALASYYLGLFSLIPLLGLPMGICAVWLGVRGLKNVRENPAVRGGVHAWVGIICGSLFGLFNLALVILIIIGVIAAVSRAR